MLMKTLSLRHQHGSDAITVLFFYLCGRISKNRVSKFHPIVCEYCLWPRIGHPVTKCNRLCRAYSQFCDDAIFSRKVSSVPQNRLHDMHTFVRLTVTSHKFSTYRPCMYFYVLCFALLYAPLFVFLSDCSFVIFHSLMCLYVNQIAHVSLILINEDHDYVGKTK